MERYFSYSRVLFVATLTFVGAGCASNPPAPVEERSLNAPPRPSTTSSGATARGSERNGGSIYRVQRGDTLYSIAFRNGLDYRELAAANGIGSSYKIYVGQELKFATRTQPPPRVATTVGPNATSRETSSVTMPPQTSESAPPPPQRAADVPHFENVAPGALTTAPPPVDDGTTLTSTPNAPVAAPVATLTTPAPTPLPPSIVKPPDTNTVVATTGEVGWRWPADGSIVGGFVGSDPTKQGIDIAGKAGDPVRAAADGTVVYSGNGLIGYGELIIVKHSASLLSAYGHNSKRLVKEGDRVRAGQVIAEMGSSSASRDSLHFEIRKNGKPTNPSDYLPRR